jgi:hypothetical protein
MDENLLSRVAHTITHFGDDPLFDYGILGGVIGMAAGMIYCIATGKVSDDTITMDREDYSWRE